MDSLWDWLWLTIWWFFFIAFLMILFRIFGDIFRDHSMGGWGKALWCVVLVFLPAIGACVYLIARGGGMAERSVRAQQQVQAAQADYIRSVAGSGTSAADEVAKAKALYDNGTISADEFTRMKAKATA